MLVTETIKVEREVFVAPCLKCGSTDVRMHDCGYFEGNTGGGTCNSCGAKTVGVCGHDPKVDGLAAIWNRGNDILTLIAAEEKKVAEATARIAELNALRLSREVAWFGIADREERYDRSY